MIPKKNFFNSKFFVKLCIAALIFNQAVFLLPKPVGAMTTDTYYGTIPTSISANFINPASSVYLNTSYFVQFSATVESAEFRVRKSDALQPVSFPAVPADGTNVYTFVWEVANFENGSYIISVLGKINGMYTAPKEIFVTLNKPATLSPSVTFASGFPTYVTQNASFKIYTNIAVDRVIFVLEDESLRKVEFPGIKVSDTSYYFTWDVSSFTNGNYKIHAIAYKGTLTANNMISVSLNKTLPLSIIFTNPVSSISTNTVFRTKVNLPEVDGVRYDLKNLRTNAVNSFEGIRTIEPMIYVFEWKVDTFTNDTYELTATVKKDLQQVPVKIVVLLNKELSSDAMTLPTDQSALSSVATSSAEAITPAVEVEATPISTQPTATSTQEDLKLNINIIYPSSIVTDNVKIYAKTSVPADEVKFNVVGPVSGYFRAALTLDASGNPVYAFVWDVVNYINGSYKITALATKNGVISASIPVYLKLEKPVSTVKTATTTIPVSATTTATSTNVAEQLINKVVTVAPTTLAIVSPSQYSIISGIARIFLKSNSGLKEVKIFKNSMTTPIGAAFSNGNNEWFFNLDTNKEIDGMLILKAIGTDELLRKIYSNEIKVTVKNKVVSETKNVVNTTTTVVEAPKPIQAPIIDFNQEMGVIKAPIKTDAPTEDKVVSSLTEAEIPANENRLLSPKINMIEACREAKIETKNDCVLFVRNNLKNLFVCNYANQAECDRYLEKVLLADFIDKKIADAATRELAPLVNKSILINGGTTTNQNEITIAVKEKDVVTALPKEKTINLEKILPFRSDQSVKLMVLGAEEDKKEMTMPAVVLLDSDSDDLPDEFELRIGSNPSNPDSDGDGNIDSVEVSKGYNPIGKGKMEKQLDPVEKAIVNKATFEQPRALFLASSTKANPDFKAEVKNSDENKLKFIGQAKPKQLITLYLYSTLPIIVTVMTDENGNWVYELDKSLVDGKHEAYVVINDEQGKIKEQSAPLSFFVKEAKAVSQNDFIVSESKVYDKSDTLLGWYVATGLASILFMIAVYFLYSRSRNLEKLN